jgi:hypothetical protein
VVREIPIPPKCPICDSPVGLWEPIVVALHAPAEWTTWLRLAEDDELQEPVWHHQCAATIT